MCAGSTTLAFIAIVGVGYVHDHGEDFEHDDGLGDGVGDA